MSTNKRSKQLTTTDRNKRSKNAHLKQQYDSDSDSSSSDDDEHKTNDEITFDTNNNNNTQSDNDDSSDTDDITHIDVTFEYRDPDQSDWWSIKALLGNNYIQPVKSSNKRQKTSHNVKDMILDDTVFNTTEYATLVCSQPQVGAVIHTDDMDNQPVGILTCISIQYFKQQSYEIQQIIDYLLHYCNDSNIHNKLQSYLTDTQYNIGLIVNERMVNTPTELIPSLHSSLQQDIVWAQQNSDNKPQFNYTHYLLICKCFYPDNPLLINTSKKSKHKQQRSVNDIKQAMYNHFEEQYYVEQSILKYSFDIEVTDKTNNAKELQSCVVAVVEADRLQNVVKQVEKIVSQELQNNNSSS